MRCEGDDAFDGRRDPKAQSLAEGLS